MNNIRGQKKEKILVEKKEIRKEKDNYLSTLVIIKEVMRTVEGRHKLYFKKLIKPKSCEDTRNSTDMTVLKIIFPY